MQQDFFWQGKWLEWNSVGVRDHLQVNYYPTLQMSVVWESGIICLMELVWGLMDWKDMVADSVPLTVLCGQSGWSDTGCRASCCCGSSIMLALIRTGDIHGQAVPAPAGQFFPGAAFGGSCCGPPVMWMWLWYASMFWSSRSTRQPVDFCWKDWGRGGEIGSLQITS
jgi:hypothetical protein